MKSALEQSSSLFGGSLDFNEQSSSAAEEPFDPSESKLEHILESQATLTQTDILEQLQTDETVHAVINKIFALQRTFESETSELKHKIKMQQMQIEEGESLKFDIELLNDDKIMLEQDLAASKVTVSNLEIRLQEMSK